MPHIFYGGPSTEEEELSVDTATNPIPQTTTLPSTNSGRDEKDGRNAQTTENAGRTVIMVGITIKRHYDRSREEKATIQEIVETQHMTGLNGSMQWKGEETFLDTLAEKALA
jgi:hypothetical protein